MSVVAATDAEAERIGTAGVAATVDAGPRCASASSRDRNADRGAGRATCRGAAPASGDGLIYGSPATVAAAIAEIAALGVGGVIATFRLGPMPHEAAAESLRLFMSEVAPAFRHD